MEEEKKVHLNLFPNTNAVCETVLAKSSLLNLMYIMIMSKNEMLIFMLLMPEGVLCEGGSITAAIAVTELQGLPGVLNSAKVVTGSTSRNTVNCQGLQ